MDGALKRLIGHMGASLVSAARMCATSPAAQLGLADRGRIAPGQRADLAILDHDLRPVATYVAGVAWSG
jgi:N-acetylglucosamine-6-phosphate deacetylase